MGTEKKFGKNQIPDLVMNEILQMIQDVCYGEVVLIVQDSRLIQIERNEKIHLEQCRICRRPHRLSREDERHVRSQIAHFFHDLPYGKIEIVIKGSQVVRIDKTEKRRFSDLSCDQAVIRETVG